jgi:hypothetical protein
MAFWWFITAAVIYFAGYEHGVRTMMETVKELMQ